MTFMLPVELTEPEEQPGYRAVMQAARAAETPFVSFFTPTEMLALAREAGFRDARHVSAADNVRRYFAGPPTASGPPPRRHSW
jgi:hypothetical protein